MIETIFGWIVIVEGETSTSIKPRKSESKLREKIKERMQEINTMSIHHPIIKLLLLVVASLQSTLCS